MAGKTDSGSIMSPSAPQLPADLTPHAYEILPPVARSVSLMSCSLASGWPARIDWNAAAAWTASGPGMVLCPRGALWDV